MPSDRFGAELRRRRAAANMSLTELSRLVHYDKGHLSKVERGRRPASMPLARICDTVLNARGVLAILVEVPTLATGPALDPLPPADSRTLADIAELIAEYGDQVGDGVDSAALAAVADDARTPDRFRELFDLLRRQGRQSHPGLVLPTVLTTARLLCRLGAAAAEPVRAQLLALAAHYLEFAGWMAQETGNDERAIHLTTAAGSLAAPAEAPQLAPYAQVRYAELALYRGEARRVVELAERAERDRAATVRVRVLAAQRAAQGHALGGSADDCEAALDRAARLNRGPDACSDSEIWLGSAAAGRTDRLVRGWCYYDLGRPERAADLLAQGLAEMPAEAVRARTLYGVRLSLARAASGDVEGACGLADEALSRARLVGSATVRHQLRQLEKELTRWRRRPCVRHVQARMAALTAG
nr:helix-turn-helix domain-containing protein [Micromonospora sp. DSM 115978]